jgi:hypothetical protein
MLAAKRIRGLSSLTPLFIGFILGLSASSGCSATNQTAGSMDESRVATGAKPTQNCEQYLAMLSDERKQEVGPNYGSGGSCWIGGKDQARKCDQICKQSVYDIIRRSLNKNASSAAS